MVLREVLDLRLQGSKLPIHGHILVFLDSIKAIQIVRKKLKNLIRSYERDRFVIIDLHEKTSSQNQAKIFEDDVQEGLFKTKIVLATKVAECAITIDGVSVVIDSGYTSESVYYPEHRMTYTMQ